LKLSTLGKFITDKEDSDHPASTHLPNTQRQDWYPEVPPLIDSKDPRRGPL
jgi:hypothetical protein